HNLKVEVDEDLPPVRVDEKAVAEVLYVLIDNATKYSPPGKEILIHAGKTNDNRIKVSVQDEGPGIAPSLREKVFEKFFLISSDGAGHAAGLGMGLAIARAIIEAHMGRIFIDVAGNHGTCVSFELPLQENHPLVKVS